MMLKRVVILIVLGLIFSSCDFIYYGKIAVQDNIQYLEREKEIARHQLEAEGKPANIIEKILEGKMRKFYEENCLLNQKYVRDDSVTIEQFIAPLTIVSFDRFKVGEGIEKEEVDFAAEVAAQLGQ